MTTRLVKVDDAVVYIDGTGSRYDAIVTSVQGQELANSNCHLILLAPGATVMASGATSLLGALKIGDRQFVVHESVQPTNCWAWPDELK